MRESQTRDHRSDCFVRRSHRLGVIGDLTADVAHHLNNLATSVMGAAGLIERAVEHDNGSGEHLDSLKKAARAIGDTTRTLQNFAADEPGPHAPVRLDALVAEVAPMLRLPASVRLLVPKAPPPIAVLGSAADLRHIVAAMLLIAREATESRGEIEIVLRVDENRCALEVMARPDAAGGAMAEPYWASPASMRVIREIAADHAGALTDSETPGCTRLQLPVLSRDPAFDAMPAPGPESGAGRLVLLQMSDRQTRSLLATALLGTGFRVIEASTPEDAERLAAEAADGCEAPGALVIEHPGPLPEGLQKLGAPVVWIRDPEAPPESQQAPTLAAVLTRPYKMIDLVRTLAGVVNEHMDPHPPEAKG